MEFNSYEQSLNLIVKAAHLHYIRSLSQSEIAKQLDISVPTVSRLIKKAKQYGIIKFVIPENYKSCIELEEFLRESLSVRDVVVCPARADSVNIKNDVALEGARYLQRLISEDDTLGIAWGRTIRLLINYLNPCLKKNVPFITLHGSITESDADLDPCTLSNRVAMSFGGGKYTLYSEGLLSDCNVLETRKQEVQVKKVLDYFKKCTISVSGAGSFYPLLDSPIPKMLTQEQIDELISLDVYGDLMLHFIDKDGRECDSSLKNSHLGIDLDTYKKIPTKIIVAAGAFKARTISAFVKGGYVDVLIIDQTLAEELARQIKACPLC